MGSTLEKKFESQEELSFQCISETRTARSYQLAAHSSGAGSRGSHDVGEHVRRGVEEVFEDVSLKSKVGVLDLHRLISDVPRRVEHEVMFEGTGRRINFMFTLLPPTTSAVAHLLMWGGLPPSYGDAHDLAFTSLLEETRDVFASANFQRCLDRVMSVLFNGLREDVFVPDDGEDGEQVRLRLSGMLPSVARWPTPALASLLFVPIMGAAGVAK
ncbi:hypothetical protein OF83DRAFT_1178392 [Amylostereum chailletii]|nr:hypothetical protein OF83DRAFT_1178392 [Amylostereum chailletii]